MHVKTRGLLTQFEGLLELDTDVSQLLIHQDQFTEKFLQDLDSCDHEMVKEFSDMVSSFILQIFDVFFSTEFLSQFLDEENGFVQIKSKSNQK